MARATITREGVLNAIKEFDGSGKDTFLKLSRTRLFLQLELESDATTGRTDALEVSPIVSADAET